MNEKKDLKYIDITPEKNSPSSEKLTSNTIPITLDEVLRVSCGTDAVGQPLAAGVLAIDQLLENGDPITKENLFLEKAEYLIHANGGCVVLEIFFPLQGQVYYQRAYTICQDWLKKESNSQEVLTLLLSPYLTNGCIHILFQGLAFVFGVPESEQGFRLFLGFDHNHTLTFETNDVDYGLIIQQVQAEIKRQEDELMNELEDAKQAEAEASRANSFQYGEHIQKQYSSENMIPIPEKEIDKGTLRSRKEYRGMRIAKDEENDE